MDASSRCECESRHGPVEIEMGMPVDCAILWIGSVRAQLGQLAGQLIDSGLKEGGSREGRGARRGRSTSKCD